MSTGIRLQLNTVWRIRFVVKERNNGCGTFNILYLEGYICRFALLCIGNDKIMRFYRRLPLSWLPADNCARSAEKMRTQNCAAYAAYIRGTDFRIRLNRNIGYFFRSPQSAYRLLGYACGRTQRQPGGEPKKAKADLT